jgi:hypothetical protein
MNQSYPQSNDGVRRNVAGSASFAAGALLLVCALLTLLQGISAIVNDQLLIIGPDYVYKFNTTGWGWIHIVVAILSGIIAFGLMFSAGGGNRHGVDIHRCDVFVAALLPGVVSSGDRTRCHRDLGCRDMGHSGSRPER